MMKNTIMAVESDEQNCILRPIRSFVLRNGRLSKRQQQAIEEHWAELGVDYIGTLIDFSSFFPTKAPLIIEIGFGMGTSLVEMAKEYPNHNFVGIDVHLPGVGACLALAKEAGISNLRIMCHDAVEVLQNSVFDNALSRVQLYFPDPWHKIKHRKRRIVQPEFVALVRKKLQLGGQFHMATDWQNYAQQMLRVMTQAEGFQNVFPDTGYALTPPYRSKTKFEQRGRRLGHDVWDLLFEHILLHNS